MSRTKTLRVTPEELELLQKLRAGNINTEKIVEAAETPPVIVAESTDPSVAATKQLAAALTEALNATKTPEKKNIFTRKISKPWWPKNGEPREKMNRKFYQHGLEIERVDNETIRLLNQIRPGLYCEGHIKVTLRRDRGIDIDYPIKTSSQRLKLVHQFGIPSFKEILQPFLN